MQVQGHVDPKYSLIAEAFSDNFINDGEIGASLCVYHRHELVIDVWSGFQDLKNKKIWKQNKSIYFIGKKSDKY